MTAEEDDRRQVIAENVERVRARVDRACAAVGRPPEDVTLVAVTKTFPVSDVVHLAALGLCAMGENRDGEAAAKAAQASDAGLDHLEWHFVGQVQRNKAASVAAYADVVHSVDRLPLVTALDAAAGRVGRRLVGLVQVDLREPVGEDGRGGAAPDQVAALAAAVEAAEHLVLGGVMAVAPLGDDPSTAVRAFSRLAEMSQRLRADHPGATIVSAGMSGDLEAAIESGATHLRVGTALLGSRPPLG